MSSFMLAYIPRKTPLHALCGTTKFVFFMLWSVLAMITYDTRIMLIMAAVSAVVFAVSRTRFSEISFIVKFLVVFMMVNLVTIYLFEPEQGVLVYGTRTVLAEGFGRYTLTAEQLFYEFNVLLKYNMVVPVAIVLIVTTQPSEFASSLNRIGVPYTVAYAVSLTLRYIPDIQRDFRDISRAQQARGVELSRKNSFRKRLKGAAAILLPLIFSSLARIDTISQAMELRGFGKHRKRTWYSGKPFTRTDAAVVCIGVLFFAFGAWFTFRDGNRFYNPFTGR